MERVRIADVEVPPSNSPASVVRPLADALGTTGFSMNYFELAPGEQFGYDYHRHHDQEEVFYVQAGTATFRTETGDVDVPAGSVIRFAPGELQLGENRGDERVVAFAIGAPRETTDIEYVRPCPECGTDTIQVPELDGTTLTVRCTRCDTVLDEFYL